MNAKVKANANANASVNTISHLQTSPLVIPRGVLCPLWVVNPHWVPAFQMEHLEHRTRVVGSLNGPKAKQSKAQTSSKSRRMTSPHEQQPDNYQTIAPMLSGFLSCSVDMIGIGSGIDIGIGIGIRIWHS